MECTPQNFHLKENLLLFTEEIILTHQLSTTLTNNL